jgi:multidrug efflux pump
VAPQPRAGITVRGQIYDSASSAHRHRPDRAAAGADPRALPAGYRIETGGAVEESAKGRLGERRHSAVPGGGVHVLMVQLGSFSRTTMVVLTAPLG